MPQTWIPPRGELEKKVVFYRAVEMKQSHTLTEPFEKEAARPASGRKTDRMDGTGGFIRPGNEEPLAGEEPDPRPDGAAGKAGEGRLNADVSPAGGTCVTPS